MSINSKVTSGDEITKEGLFVSGVAGAVGGRLVKVDNTKDALNTVGVATATGIAVSGSDRIGQNKSKDDKDNDDKNKKHENWWEKYFHDR